MISVTVANLILMGPIKVQSNAYDAITFSSVKAEQTNQTGDGTMVHIMRNGKCLFFNWRLYILTVLMTYRIPRNQMKTGYISNLHSYVMVTKGG